MTDPIYTPKSPSDGGTPLRELPDKKARIYPCHECGVMRSQDEGGTVFTVCEKCWDELYPSKNEPPAPAPQRAAEEVAARVRLLKWATAMAVERFDCFDEFEAAVAAAFRPHNMPMFADEVEKALHDLCAWAADGADEQTRAALEAAAAAIAAGREEKP